MQLILLYSLPNLPKCYINKLIVAQVSTLEARHADLNDVKIISSAVRLFNKLIKEGIPMEQIRMALPEWTSSDDNVIPLLLTALP